MPYVEVWVDSAEGLTREQAKTMAGLESAIRKALKIMPSGDEEGELRAAWNALAKATDFNPLATVETAADRKYREWQKRKAGAGEAASA